MAGRLILDLPNPSLDAGGSIDTGATLTFYENGTTTPQAVYSDPTLATALSNPLACDAAGRFVEVWAPDASVYSVKWTLTSGSPITFDDIAPWTPSIDAAVSVRMFGAKGDGSTDDTVAIRNAIAYAAANQRRLFIPGATYKVVPSISSAQEGGTLLACFIMPSNMNIEAENGACFRIADGISTDLAPQRMAMFHTNVPIANIAIRGLTMDMNGANNPISPGRPTTYNTAFNQAQISVSGTISGIAARIDNALIENCSFINTPGTNCIVAGQSNTASVQLGTRWTLRRNLFHDNGLDTNDHTSVYLWVEDSTATDDVFTATNAYQGGVGGKAAYEIHGRNIGIYNPCVLGNAYDRGVRIDGNFTRATTNARIVGGVLETVSYGVTVERVAATETEVTNWLVSGVSVNFDNATFTGQSLPKVGILVISAYSVSDGVVVDCIVTKSGTTSTSPSGTLGTVASATAVGHKTANVRFLNNNGYGLTQGIRFVTNSTNDLGYLEASGNIFYDSVHTTALSAIGIFANLNTKNIDTLVIDNNRFINGEYGIYLAASGTVTNLFVGPQVYIGMSASNYFENAPTVTSRAGVAVAPLPTATTYLPTGAVYNNSGTLAIS